MAVNQVDENTQPRVVMLTGAHGAIGSAIARAILQRPDHSLVLVCRSEKSGREAQARVQQESQNARVRFMVCDVSRRAAVFDLAARFEGPLHVLINNAATSPRERRVSEEGIELQLATNVLGYVWMTQAFAPLLSRSAPARIVNVASYWAGDLDLTDLEFKRRRYDNNAAYRQSKQANRMLTVAHAERLSPLGISVNACHPGDVSSKLSNDLGFGGSMSADEGAKTPAFLALDDAGITHTGKYFASCRIAPCEFASDAEGIRNLDEICERYGAR